METEIYKLEKGWNKTREIVLFTNKGVVVLTGIKCRTIFFYFYLLVKSNVCKPSNVADLAQKNSADNKKVK